ncbi:hypothetical protein T265_07812 [Opisthorchis viverrini]|uniref:Uncharacterized protein n=1 Tax=Opisthorchis viverrini TaxID=6198 RepID=A0A074ZBM0_OPIVI|nr:hypothetical protein T265_07812 [Opisthorchis viverrini]KER24543.1 hypothetical protein T265_07812 [Opisthorchis viverrini]
MVTLNALLLDRKRTTVECFLRSILRDDPSGKSAKLLTGRSVVRIPPLPLDFPCLGLGSLEVSQPSCFLRATECGAPGRPMFQLVRYSRYRDTATFSSLQFKAGWCTNECILRIPYNFVSTRLTDGLMSLKKGEADHGLSSSHKRIKTHRFRKCLVTIGRFILGNKSTDCRQTFPNTMGFDPQRGRDEPSLGDLTVSQSLCLLRVAWQLGTGSMLHLNDFLCWASFCS